MKVLLISEVALLAEEIEDAASCNTRSVHRVGASPGLLFSREPQLRFDIPNDDAVDNSEDSKVNRRNGEQSSNHASTSTDTNTGGKWRSSFKKASGKKRAEHVNLVDSTTKAEIEKLLEWEEPPKQKLAVRIILVVQLLCFLDVHTLIHVPRISFTL